MRRLLPCLLAVLVCVGSFTPSASAADIVLYASDAGTLRGGWTRTADSSAAGGQRLNTSDNGAPTVGAPLASPGDYAEFTFSASAGTPYRLWLRLKAESNSKFNDSLYVQLSDALDANGSAIYRIGTTNGLTVNLAACESCGMFGWGWIAGAYWLNQQTTLTFASSGTHTLRIQTREDGVSVDQIVLSTGTFLNSAPGSSTSDATIVPRSPTSSGGGGSTPFYGTPASIPGTILTQDFDNGGEGIAYHDSTSGNTGGAYRQSGVDLESSADGGNNVGWIDAGEWLNYTVNVAASGSYTATFRVASSGQGGAFHLDVDGVNVSGSIGIPNTGGWQSWQSVAKTVTLSSGVHVARLVMDAVGSNGAVGNINSLKFASAGGSQTGGGTVGSAGAFGGSPVTLPGTIDSWNFDTGGEGVSYHDTTSGNSGGAFRSTDVDLEASNDGGYDVGWTAPGEWLNYTANATAAGAYTVQLRVASPAGASLHVGFNGPSNVWQVVTVPATGGWQSWTTVSFSASLGGGVQQMTLLFDTGGVNVGKISVVSGSTAGGAGGGGGESSGGDVSVPSQPSGGNRITVAAGGDLQKAIDAAQPGDTILLTPGATYRGIFNLPAKSGSSYITIRSAASDSQLPGPGVRMTPAYASQLPKIQGGVAGAPAFTTSAGAHHYYLQFLEVTSTYAPNQIIEFGRDASPQTTLSSVPHDLVIDRCYIHGDASNGQKRGIALNSASTWIVNSHISDIKSGSEDSQAIAGWNGPGPFTIENNYLEAAGENVLFGGGDPAISNMVPSDISFRYNYVTKKTSWRGSGWTVKNLLELKNAQRMVIDSNIFENNWEAAQSGYSIVLTPRNQGGSAPWSVVQQIEFTNNIVRHVSSVFNILGQDDENASRLTNAVTVRNNLFDDVSSSRWGGAGLLVLTQGGSNISFDHNTVFTDASSVVYADATTVSGFTFTNNIIPDNNYAVMGGNASEGTVTLNKFFPGAVFQANVIVGGNSGAYPSGNFFPSSTSGVGFVDVNGGDYRLSSSSPYRSRGTDGQDIGVNVSALPK
jgi:hypothetical protein